jgi:hypothetical protein
LENVLCDPRADQLAPVKAFEPVKLQLRVVVFLLSWRAARMLLYFCIFYFDSCFLSGVAQIIGFYFAPGSSETKNHLSSVMCIGIISRGEKQSGVDVTILVVLFLGRGKVSIAVLRWRFFGAFSNFDKLNSVSQPVEFGSLQ